jgi:hypothetical protein
MRSSPPSTSRPSRQRRWLILGGILLFFGFAAFAVTQVPRNSSRSQDCNRLRSLGCVAHLYLSEEGKPPTNIETLVEFSGGSIVPKFFVSPYGRTLGVPPPHFLFDFRRLTGGAEDIIGWRSPVIEPERIPAVFADAHTEVLSAAELAAHLARPLPP